MHFSVRRQLLWFLFLTFPFLLIIQTTAAKCHPDDYNALLEFKSSITADPAGLLSQWKAGTDCCEWLGVSCHDASRRVNVFSVTGEELSGTISPALSKLVFLESFALQHLHNLSGPFPDFIFGFPKLEYLYIDNCNLSGPLPDKIGSLTRLTILSLAGNKFSGPLPDKFASLPLLTHLNLGKNRFSGRIPTSITKLTGLTELNLGSNFLRGTIPYGLCNLKYLISLRLDRNLLSGAIPDFFNSFPELYSIHLSYNKFHGQIPASISSLAPILAFLELGHNSLTGNIPSFLGNFHKLDTLDLSSNHFTGVVPKSFSNLTKIFNLDLSHNSLVDPFPALKVMGIESLDLSYNSFHLGQIPKWVTWSPIAYSIKLAKCGIKMKLDDWKPKETVFYDYLDLSDNEISGSPVWLLNQTNYLLSFKASGNQLKFDLGKLKISKMMKDLDLSRNQIFGKVPMGVAAVKRLNVSQNHLCGSIPENKLTASAFAGNSCLCGSPLRPCFIHYR